MHVYKCDENLFVFQEIFREGSQTTRQKSIAMVIASKF